MDIYKLYRDFWDFSFANPDKIRPNHCAVYSFAVEHCNRLGWKPVFGFPTSMAMEATGIKSYNVYKKTFDELVDFKFFEVHQYSRNQYSSNMIALKDFNKANNKAKSKANNKALDKALSKHIKKQVGSTQQSTGESTVQRKCSIDKQVYNSTNLPIDNNTVLLKKEPKGTIQKFDFLIFLKEKNASEKLAAEWLAVRKTKKLTSTETAAADFMAEVAKSGMDINEVLQECIVRSWGGFKFSWLVREREKESPSASLRDRAVGGVKTMATGVQPAVGSLSAGYEGFNGSAKVVG